MHMRMLVGSLWQWLRPQRHMQKVGKGRRLYGVCLWQGGGGGGESDGFNCCGVEPPANVAVSRARSWCRCLATPP